MTDSTQKDTTAIVDRVFSGVQGWSKNSFQDPDGIRPRKVDLELALVVLLVDLAGSDQNFDQSEYQVIVDGMHSIFGTNALQVKALVNQANLVLKDLRGTSRYGSLLKENLNPTQHAAIMEIVDAVIAADGVQDGFEMYFRYKISKVLGIEIPEKKEKQS